MKTATLTRCVLALILAGSCDQALCHQADGGAATASSALTRRSAVYAAPAVELVREDGKTVRFVDEVNQDGPVVLNFIFTSCGTICPLASRTFAVVQDKLGARRERVRLMSVSIDPEQDTPARLAEYAAKYHAGPQWHHYTGTLAAVKTIQQAFDAYRGQKMEHAPVTLLRRAAGDHWIRFDGFVGADALLNEITPALAGP